MRVPMKVDYGVRALVYLAQNYGADRRPIQAAEIASRQSIPEAYLDQLLTTLHKFGFIHSRRGPQGGHALAQPPEEISLNMVMAMLEGTGAHHLDCIEDPDECTLSGTCAQREVWRTIEDSVQSLLSSTSIADLVSRQRQLSVRGV